MRSPKRTSGSEASAWAVPWSTRAVILLAFAIQLMPVAERVGPHAPRQADRLVLSDGRLVALWLADRAAERGLAAPAASEARGAHERPDLARPAESADLPRETAGYRECGLMPIPPPAIA